MTPDRPPHASAPPPFPIAALLRRSRNAKSPKERHDTAYHAWEASVRLAAAARLASPAHGEKPARRLEAPASRLNAPTAGDWVQAAALEDARALDAEALLDAHALLREVGRDEPGRQARITPRALLEPLAAYRNRVLGHGAVRDPTFYERAAATLVRGLIAAWDAGVFARPSARLVYVDAIEIDEHGRRRARIYDLSGASPALLDPRGTTGIAEDTRPRRVYLAEEQAGSQSTGWSLAPLHPFVVFQEAELRERCLFYNGRRRGAEMLDLVSGECLRGSALAAALPGIEEEIARAIDALERTGGGRDGEAEGPGRRQEVGAGTGAGTGTGAEENRLGDFAILGRLGAGGMGVVYLARQESLGRLVALKTLPSDGTRDETSRRRFEREIAALSRCDHPNVVKILASGHDEARRAPYYAMEYVEGADLGLVARALGASGDLDTAISSASEKRRAERRELLPDVPFVKRPEPARPAGERPRDRFRRLAALFRDAARGVEHLHQNGVLHRDLKPSNLMISSSDGRVVVMDLGLASVTGAMGSLTRSGAGLLGTLRYMAPEQVRRGVLALDGRADVYALGASLHELVTGRPLFDGDSEARLVEQVLHDEPVAADRIDRAVPRDLALIIRRAVEKDRRRRYETAADLAQDLDAFLEGRPVAARPPTIGYLLRLAVLRNRARAAALGSALLFLVASIAGYAFWLDRARGTEAALRRDAERSREEARALVEFILGDLAVRLQPLGRLDVLEEAAMRTKEHLEAQSREELAIEDRRNLAVALNLVATLLRYRGRDDEAVAAIDRAVEVAAGAARDAPEDPIAYAVLAECRTSRGSCYEFLRSAEAATPDLREACTAAERMLALTPGSDEARLRLAVAFAMRSRNETRVGDRDAARSSALRALELLGPSAGEARGSPEFYARLRVEIEAGRALAASGEPARGVALARGARLRIGEPPAGDVVLEMTLVQALGSLGPSLIDAGRVDEGLEALRDAYERGARLALKLRTPLDAAGLGGQYARGLLEHGRAAEARPVALAALRYVEQAIRADPTSRAAARGLVNGHALLGDACAAEGDTEGAIRSWRAGIEALEKVSTPVGAEARQRATLDELRAKVSTATALPR